MPLILRLHSTHTTSHQKSFQVDHETILWKWKLASSKAYAVNRNHQILAKTVLYKLAITHVIFLVSTLMHLKHNPITLFQSSKNWLLVELQYFHLVLWTFRYFSTFMFSWKYVRSLHVVLYWWYWNNSCSKINSKK